MSVCTLNEVQVLSMQIFCHHISLISVLECVFEGVLRMLVPPGSISISGTRLTATCPYDEAIVNNIGKNPSEIVGREGKYSVDSEEPDLEKHLSCTRDTQVDLKFYIKVKGRFSHCFGYMFLYCMFMEVVVCYASLHNFV